MDLDFLVPELLGDSFSFSFPRGRPGSSYWALLAEGPQSNLVLRTAPELFFPPQINQMGSAEI